MSFLIAPIFHGLDTDLVISADTTDTTLADAAFTGTAGSLTGSGTNASFASYLNYPVLIHQSQGTNAGLKERNYMIGYSAGTITFALPLTNTYTTGAQIVVMRSCRSLTVNAGVTWTSKAWDGTTGGILPIICSGGVFVNGTINLSGRGFRGGAAVTGGNSGKQGEGINGAAGTVTTSANGNAGGGGAGNVAFGAGGGGAGGNGTAGTSGAAGGTSGTGGAGGATSGNQDLAASGTFGGGAGSGGVYNSSGSSGAGGNGGGLLVLFTPRLVINPTTGAINLNGGDGGNASGTGGDRAGGGGGGGGSALLYIIYGSGLHKITANGGNPGTGNGSVGTPSVHDTHLFEGDIPQ
jgi:large repetitive protein